MRPDLAKCTTESPRGGRGSAIAKKYGGKVCIRHEEDFDYLDERGGFHSSSRHRQHDGGKSLSDALGALRGNVRKAVGRQWDDVYSEFCQHLDRRGISGYHIWTHLMQEVTTKTFMQDGKVMEISRYGRFNPQEVTGFYVHPETGKLEHKKESWQSWRRRLKDRKANPEIPVPGMQGWSYKLIDGLWFRSAFAEVKNPITGRTERVVVTRRSANKKEIVWIKKQLAHSFTG